MIWGQVPLAQQDLRLPDGDDHDGRWTSAWWQPRVYRETLAAMTLLRPSDGVNIFPEPRVGHTETCGLMAIDACPRKPPDIDLLLLTQPDVPLTPAADHFASCIASVCGGLTRPRCPLVDLQGRESGPGRAGEIAVDNAAWQRCPARCHGRTSNEELPIPAYSRWQGRTCTATSLAVQWLLSGSRSGRVADTSRPLCTCRDYAQMKPYRWRRGSCMERGFSGRFARRTGWRPARLSRQWLTNTGSTACHPMQLPGRIGQPGVLSAAAQLPCAIDH